MRLIEKRLTKILCASMAFIMALGYASVQNLQEVHAAWVTQNGSIVKEIKAVELKTGRETLSIYDDYVIRSMESDFGKEDTVCVTSAPITLTSTGTLYIQPLEYFVGTAMEFSLYKDAECTIKVDESVYWELAVDEENEFKEIKRFDITEPGTYYLGTITDKYIGEGDEKARYDNVVKFKPYFVSNAEKEMRSGSWTSIDRMGDEAQWLAFKIKEKGYATFKAGSDMEFEICDRDRTMIQKVDLVKNEEIMLEMEAGDYYIKISGIEDTYSALKFEFSTKSYAEPEGDFSAITNHEDYIEYIPSGSGYLTVTNVSRIEDGKVSIALYDSNKKPLSLITNTSTSSGTDGAVYGVTNGTKYYIWAKSELDVILLDKKLTTVSESSGLSQDEAENVPESTVVEGTLTAGAGSEADWYKFTVSERREVVINIDGIINGIMEAEIYNSKGKKLGTATLDNNIKKTQLKSTGTMKEDTYYLKLKPVGSVTTGYYCLEWH